MTTFLIIVAVLVGALIFYAMRGRAWLLTKPWAKGFFKWVEPIETTLFRKSETILVGRLLSFGGVIVTFYDSIAVFFSSLDMTPITSRVLYQIPEDMRTLVVSGFIALLGMLMSWLRKRSSKPIEIVELPIDAPPEVAKPAERAVAANEKAVATIQAAQADGKVA